MFGLRFVCDCSPQQSATGMWRKLFDYRERGTRIRGGDLFSHTPSRPPFSNIDRYMDVPRVTLPESVPIYSPTPLDAMQEAAF